MSDKKDASNQGWSLRGNRKLIALVTGTAIVVGGAFGVQAIAGSRAYEHLRLSAAFDGGWRGGDHKPLADMSDAEIEDRVGRMVRHVAIEIDATPQQQDEIITLITAVAKDLRPLKDRMRATGMELQHLLTADTIDRAALENLRAARLAEAEQISKTLVGAIADVAEVLTPEQREVVQTLIRESRARRHRQRRG
ncbi:MAG: Spy/CpxP family protein refolding chaperone [Paracoccaceae bacterium]